MKKNFVGVAMLLCGLGMAGGSDAAESLGLSPAAKEEWCEKQWISESAKFANGTSIMNGDALLRQWRSHQARCGATYTYVGRLATIYVLMKDFAAAKAVLAKAPKELSPFAYALDAAKIQVEVAERLDDSKPITVQDMLRFEAAYAALISRYPNWPTGYALLGGVQTLQGKHVEAIKNLKMASQSDAYELFGVYRNLTISYAATGAYQSALDAADKAYELNEELTSDSAYMLSAAYSNSALGRLDDAESLLRLILAKRPEVRSDSEFIRTVDFFKQQRNRLAAK